MSGDLSLKIFDLLAVQPDNNSAISHAIQTICQRIEQYNIIILSQAHQRHNHAIDGSAHIDPGELIHAQHWPVGGTPLPQQAISVVAMLHHQHRIHGTLFMHTSN